MKRHFPIAIKVFLLVCPLFAMTGCTRSETLNYSVSYLAGDGGTLTYTLDGKVSTGHSYYIQYVFRGKNSEEVTAVPKAATSTSKGYVFVEWKEDGSTSPTRFEEKVYQNYVFTAVFAQES